MRAYKRMNKTNLAILALSMLTVGGVASIGVQSFAQTTTDTGATSSEKYSFMDDDDNVVLPSGGLTEAQATQVVITQYPNLTIKHIHLEDEHGAVVYSAKLSDGTEAIVDAMTGLVSLETEEQEATEHQGMGKGHMKGHGKTSEANDTEVDDGQNGPTDIGE